MKEDIKRTNYIDVEITGPIKNYGKISYNKLIGYCDDLYRIDINDITLVYTDGKTETGSFNYYVTK